MCMDIKDLYLAKNMERAKYMWVPVSMLLDEIMEKY